MLLSPSCCAWRRPEWAETRVAEGGGAPRVPSRARSTSRSPALLAESERRVHIASTPRIERDYKLQLLLLRKRKGGGSKLLMHILGWDPFHPEPHLTKFHLGCHPGAQLNRPGAQPAASPAGWPGGRSSFGEQGPPSPDEPGLSKSSWEVGPPCLLAKIEDAQRKSPPEHFSCKTTVWCSGH